MANFVKLPYKRVQQLTCTEAERIAFGPQTLLLENEILYVIQPDGSRNVYFGDGVHYLNELRPSLNAASVGGVSVDAPVSHRNIFRGKNLGSKVTPNQKDAIQSGSFDDLFIGDYWTINGHKYQIADMDYWYNTGDTAFVKHHLVMIPVVPMYLYVMNDTNTTAGGYAGSKMHAEGLNQAREQVLADFGDMLLTHREFLTNAITNNYASAAAWYDSDVELMNEIMVCGAFIFSNVANGTAIPCNYTADKQQLALFRLNPMCIKSLSGCWLRDIVSSVYFGYVGGDGIIRYTAASYNNAVLPAFPLG